MAELRNDTGENPPTRVAIWGLGGHAIRNIAPALVQCRTTELVAAHTRNSQVLLEAADSFDFQPYEEVEAMLEDAAVDAVYLAIPTGLHHGAALRVLAADKHVWCEKPLTDTEEATREVMALAEVRGRVALETDMFLHHPQFVELKALVLSNELGPVRSVTGRFGFPHRPPDDFRYSRRLGGGASLDAGFYPLAAAISLLGPGLELAAANLQTDPRFEIDVGGSAMLVKGQQSAFIDWGFGRSYRSEIEVWCEEGAAFAERAYAKPDDLETSVNVVRQGGDVTLAIEAANHFVLMFTQFAAITQGLATADVTQVLERARLLTAVRSVL